MENNTNNNSAARDAGRKRSPQRLEFLSDIITTAVEGGIGYWADVTKYRWQNVPSTIADIVEYESSDDNPPKSGQLNVDTIARAIGRIVRGEIRLRADLIKTIAGANATNDGGDIDAEGADVIAQVAILGDVIYG